MSLTIDIDVFAVSTLDLLAIECKLEHDTAVLTLLLSILGRGHLVHGHAA